MKLDELDFMDAESPATYEEIKDYVLKLKVSSRLLQCPMEKEKAIEDTFKHFGMV